jgi:hypothetical protein
MQRLRQLEWNGVTSGAQVDTNGVKIGAKDVRNGVRRGAVAEASLRTLAPAPLGQSSP